MRMFQKRHLLLCSFVGIIASILVTSCISSPQPNEPTATNNTIEAPAVTQTSKPTAASPTPTATPSPTKSPTPNVTATMTVLPTWTPIARLPGDEGIELVANYLSYDEQCTIPCWWGITPGVTTWAEARTKLGAIGRISGPRGDGNTKKYEIEIVVRPSGNLTSSVVYIGVRNGVVVGIKVGGGMVTKEFVYSMPEMLNQYGMPDEIWVIANTNIPDTPNYILSLYYRDLGIYYSMAGNLMVSDNTFHICPTIHESIPYQTAFVLIDPSLKLRQNAIWFSALGTRYQGYPWIYQLEEYSSDMDTSLFYHTYTDPNTEVCFTVQPMDL